MGKLKSFCVDTVAGKKILVCVDTMACKYLEFV